MAVSIRVEQVVKKFGTLVALNKVSVAIKAGELFFLLGPSGCGKTTLLRCLAGFHRPESGRVVIDERDVTSLPPHERDTGMVFQSYALWPHLTLAENVAFGLEMRNVPKADIKRRVTEALERVHLADRAKARPNQLSGGQQQRVALARALVIEPRCLLLDEPLSNLDAKLRLEMRLEIRRIVKDAGLTAVYVTHDQKEALSIADRVAVMRNGEIEQVGTPQQIYRTPANSFVAGFVGEGNFFRGRITQVSPDGLKLETGYGELVAARGPEDLAAGDAVDLCIRPEAVRFERPPVGAANILRGHYLESVYLGEVAQHMIELPIRGGGVQAFKACELNPLGGHERAGGVAEVWVDPLQVIVTKA